MCLLGTNGEWTEICSALKSDIYEGEVNIVKIIYFSPNPDFFLTLAK